MNILRLEETILMNKVEFLEKTVFFKLDRKLIEWCFRIMIFDEFGIWLTIIYKNPMWPIFFLSYLHWTCIFTWTWSYFILAYPLLDLFLYHIILVKRYTARSWGNNILIYIHINIALNLRCNLYCCYKTDLVWFCNFDTFFIEFQWDLIKKIPDNLNCITHSINRDHMKTQRNIVIING